MAKNDNRIENQGNSISEIGPKVIMMVYIEGLKVGVGLRDRELEKQIKLLCWQIKQLQEDLQLKIKLDI